MTTQAEFIGSYPDRSATRWFAARLVTETNGFEVPEARIAHVALECGCTESERDAVIGAALDAGLIRSTMLPTIQSTGFGHVPALTRVGILTAVRYA
jgi:hypothetical protein